MHTPPSRNFEKFCASLLGPGLCLVPYLALPSLFPCGWATFELPSKKRRFFKITFWLTNFPKSLAPCASPPPPPPLRGDAGLCTYDLNHQENRDQVSQDDLSGKDHPNWKIEGCRLVKRFCIDSTSPILFTEWEWYTKHEQTITENIQIEYNLEGNAVYRPLNERNRQLMIVDAVLATNQQWASEDNLLSRIIAKSNISFNSVSSLPEIDQER